MADYVFAPAAYIDLEEIDDYTLQTWGEEQRVRYVSALFEKFDLIAARPGIGMHRPELGDGVQSVPCGEHVIFDELHNGRCHILRVLHGRRDVSSAFS